MFCLKLSCVTFKRKDKGSLKLGCVVFFFFSSSFSFWALNQAINYLFSSALQTSCKHHEPKGQSSSAQAAVLRRVLVFSALQAPSRPQFQLPRGQQPLCWGKETLREGWQVPHQKRHPPTPVVQDTQRRGHGHCLKDVLGAGLPVQIAFHSCKDITPRSLTSPAGTGHWSNSCKRHLSQCRTLLRQPRHAHGAPEKERPSLHFPCVKSSCAA